MAAAGLMMHQNCATFPLTASLSTLLHLMLWLPCLAPLKVSLALPHTVLQALPFDMLVANRITLKEWKPTSAPCSTGCLRELVSGIHVERLCSITHCFKKTFKISWV